MIGKIVNSRVAKGMVRGIVKNDRHLRRIYSTGKKLFLYCGIFVGGGLLACIVYSLFRTKKK